MGRILARACESVKQICTFARMVATVEKQQDCQPNPCDYWQDGPFFALRDKG
ncbi:MAG TPA: hypothetical protein VLS48_08010 [Anaerolineales bacterium]|nr:hypothetical protein [Anaerolineales bacterium]